MGFQNFCSKFKEFPNFQMATLLDTFQNCNLKLFIMESVKKGCHFLKKNYLIQIQKLTRINKYSAVDHKLDIQNNHQCFHVFPEKYCIIVLDLIKRIPRLPHTLGKIYPRKKLVCVSLPLLDALIKC